MVIIHGTRRTEKQLGIVADFCPICRSIQPFILKRIGLVSHIYYISFGSGKLSGHLIECKCCGVRLKADPLAYQPMEKNRARFQDIDSLMHATYPKLREINAERLAFEEQVRRSPMQIPPDVRAKYVLEPFVLLNPETEEFLAQTRMDKQSGIGCAGTLGIAILLFTLAVVAHNSPSLQDKLLGAGVVCAVVGGIYTFVQLGFSPGRYLRNRVLPKLAITLRPLQPTRDELVAAIEKCHATGMVIGKKVKPDRLYAELGKPSETVIR